MGNQEHVDLVQVEFQNPHASMPLSVTAEVYTNTSDEQILANIEKNARARPKNWLKRLPPMPGHAVIVGGGPSLVDHIDEIARNKANGATVFALNAASKLLTLYGVRPDYQIILDSRPESAALIDVMAEKHLFASQCDPVLFKLMPNAILWHSTHGDHAPDFPWYDADYTMIGGSITVGNAAPVIAFALGFRDITCYGYDSSYRDAALHAYPQALTPDEAVIAKTEFRGKTYKSSVAMKLQAQYFMIRARALKEYGVMLRVKGSGLLPDMFNAPPLTEVEKYESIWQEPAYRVHSPGERLAQTFVNWCQITDQDTVIDVGCGTGRGAAAIKRLTGADVLTLDFASNAPDGGIVPDYVMDIAAIGGRMAGVAYCTDVLEHIPPERIDATLAGLFRAAPRVFIQVSTEPDDMGALINQQLHMSVHDAYWWKDKLAEHGEVRQYEVHDGAAIFYVIKEQS